MLKMIRFFLNISQAELSRRANVDPALVSKIECGAVRDTPGILACKKRIAVALGRSVEDVFPGFKDSAEKKPKS